MHMVFKFKKRTVYEMKKPLSIQGKHIQYYDTSVRLIDAYVI